MAGDERRRANDGKEKEMVEMKVFPSREEWLKARRIVGGSDAACVLGLNPWKDNLELWMEKTGQIEPEDISKKEYVLYGTKAEAPIRQIFKLDHPELKVEYRKNNLWTNDKYPWGHASLDGTLIEKETGKKGILEIKTSNILQSMQWEKWTDEQMPPNYFAQICFYLGITEFDFAILRAQLKTIWKDTGIRLTTKEYRIEREEVQEDIDYLMKKAKEFAEQVETKTRPGLVIDF